MNKNPKTEVQQSDALSGLGQYVRFPTVGLQLRQPRGFEKDESFDGFGRRDKTASVMIVGIPGPYSEVSAGFGADQMKSRGFTVLRQNEQQVDDRPGILINFEQLAAGIVFEKWALVFGDEQKTTLVTATYPKGEAAELSALLKACVKSARFDDIPADDPSTSFPFELGRSSKLRFALAAAQAFGFTKDGEFATSPEDPLLVVGRSLGGHHPANRDTAELRIQHTAGAKNIRIESTTTITIDALPGFEILAIADDAVSTTLLRLYQVMLFTDDGYFLIQGIVDVDLSDEYLPEFKALARTFKRKSW